MRDQVLYRRHTGLFCLDRPKLILWAFITILSLLALHLGFAPLALASEGVEACLQDCAPAFDPADFVISADPASQTVTQGESGTYTLSINTINCYTGTLALSATGLPAHATFAFAPSVLVPPTDGALTITTTLETPVGTYPLTINGDSGDLHDETGVELIVVAPATDPDFAIAAAPTSRSVDPGDGINYTVSLQALDGFTGTVSLSLAGLPDGASAAFDPNALKPPGESALVVSTTADTPAGTYPLTISGDSGVLHHEASVELVVNDGSNPQPDFTLAASPATRSLMPGEETSYTVSLEAFNAFSEVVSFSVTGLSTGTLLLPDLPDGISVALNPGALAPPGESVLVVTASAATAPGTYVLVVNGDAGELHRKASVELVVETPMIDPGFALSVAPASQSVNPGAGANYTVSLQALDGFTGTVSLSLAGLPDGASAVFDPNALKPPGESVLVVSTTAETFVGMYPLTISGDSGALHHEASVELIVDAPAQQALVRVSPAEGMIFVGETAESQILLSNATDFYGLEFFMTYDPTVLQVVDADPVMVGVQIGLGDLFPSDQYVVGLNQVYTDTGLVTFGVARRAPALPVNSGGELAAITWEAIGEGASALSFTHLKLANPSGYELDAISQDGSMATTLTGQLSGTVHLQGRIDHSGAEIKISPVGLQIFTDILGWFKALTHGTLTVTAYMYGYLDAQVEVEVSPGGSVDLGTATLYGGEVTGDNLIDIGDLAYLGARFHSDDLGADINGDGSVDILDLAMAAANFLKSGPTPWAE